MCRLLSLFIRKRTELFSRKQSCDLFTSNKRKRQIEFKWTFFIPRPDLLLLDSLDKDPRPPKVLARLSVDVLQQVEGAVEGHHKARSICLGSLWPLNVAASAGGGHFFVPGKARPAVADRPAHRPVRLRPLGGDGEEAEEVVGVADGARRPALLTGAHDVHCCRSGEEPGVM